MRSRKLEDQLGTCFYFQPSGAPFGATSGEATDMVEGRETTSATRAGTWRTRPKEVATGWEPRISIALRVSSILCGLFSAFWANFQAALHGESMYVSSGAEWRVGSSLSKVGRFDCRVTRASPVAKKGYRAFTLAHATWCQSWPITMSWQNIAAFNAEALQGRFTVSPEGYYA